ncbi:MAG TPA: MDR family MFS transporter [Anaerolineae bacterium]|nr:MDR family MFS transporter [Anaerolineae bacterium]
MKETKRAWVTAFLMAGIFLSAMEATIVATAMPTIIGKLGGFAQFAWVYSIFLLTQAATVPIYGKLADLYGRKPIFVLGTGLFIIGSALCGFAHSMTQLIVFRAIQGIGAGSVLPIAMTIVGDLYPGKERAKVQGLLSSVWAVAAVMGPAMGGLIVQTIGWPWIFELNVPFGIVTIAGVVAFLHEKVEHHRHKIDYAGAITMVIGISALLFALLQAGVKWAWTSPQLIGLSAISIALFAAFMRIETRAQEPILPLPVMRQRMVLIANICAIISGGLTVGASSFLPTFAQGVLGVKPIIAGATIVTLSIGWPIASTLSGRLIWRYGYRKIEVAGMVFSMLGSVLYLAISTSSSPLYMAFCSFVMGIGLGLASTTQIVSVQSTVHWEQRGIATGSVMLSRVLGSALLVALLGTIVNTSLSKALSGTSLAQQYGVNGSVSITNLLLDPVRRATISHAHLEFLTGTLAHSIHLTFWLILVSSAIGAIVALKMPGGVPDMHGRLTSTPERVYTEATKI